MPSVGETILVVDDQPSIRDVVATILEHAGYRVLIAKDGRDARDMFQGASIDLVISDVQMPGVSGPHLIEQLRSVRPWVKCILMSAGARPAEPNVAFLAKPFSIYQLLGSVEEALKAA